MTACRWDADAKDYLSDGAPCRHDSYGDPTTHCTARRTCAQHVGPRELTCAKCLFRVRQTIRKIRDYSPLLPTAAEVEEWGRNAQGVNSEAAYLAGPAADVEAWSWRKIAAKQGGPWHLSLVEDDDDWHPYTVLTRWEFMLREDYKQPRSTPTSISSAADYLDRTLGQVAQDPGQEFSLMREEMKTCWDKVQSVLYVKPWAQRGAPCPECVMTGKVDPEKVRLRREVGHFCDDPDCDKINYDSDEADRWVCPRNRGHVWTEREYRNWVEERTGGRSA